MGHRLLPGLKQVSAASCQACSRGSTWAVSLWQSVMQLSLELLTVSCSATPFPGGSASVHVAWSVQALFFGPMCAALRMHPAWQLHGLKLLCKHLPCCLPRICLVCIFRAVVPSMTRLLSLQCSLALGFDEGAAIIKIGREEPVASMDGSGKIIWARHNEIQTVNVKSLGTEQEVSSSSADKEGMSSQALPAPVHWL